MPDLFRTLLTMTAIGSLLSVVLFALKPILKNRLSKAAQYYIWFVVLAQFLIPLTITLPTPLAQPPAATSVSDNLPSAQTNAGTPPLLTMREAIDQTVIPGLSVQTSQAGADSERPVQNSNPLPFWLSVAFVVWPLGAAIFLLWHLIAYRRFSCDVRRNCLLAWEGEAECDAVGDLNIYRGIALIDHAHASFILLYLCATVLA